MATSSDEHRTRRARLILAGITLIAATILVAAVIIVVAQRKLTTSTPPRTTTPNFATSTGGGWDASTENALAARPMLALPPEAAQPHALATRNVWPPITPVGALAQLKALDENGLAGGDPAVYAHAYRQMSLPGAPDPNVTGFMALLISFRAHAGLPDTGPAPDLTVSYAITEGQIKGSADNGRYTVACVLGELTVQTQSQTSSIGVGDCQALRWTGTDWRISPGTLAAAAPCAWPGSVESVDAGYRELS